MSSMTSRLDAAVNRVMAFARLADDPLRWHILALLLKFLLFLLGSLGPSLQLGAALFLRVLDTRGVQLSAHDVIRTPRQILHAGRARTSTIESPAVCGLRP